MSDTYHIGEVASRTGLSLRTVRSYDELGLVRPSGRTEGGFRLYRERDVRRLMLVRALKPAEFSVDELGEILELRDRLGSGRGTTDDAARLASLVEVAGQRLRINRERLVAAEVAVEVLRAVVPESEPAAVGTPGS